MKVLAEALMLLLPHGGHWFGGAEGAVQIQWAAKAEMPDAVVAWELSYGRTVIQHGRLGLRSGAEPSRLAITMPEVRTATTLKLSCRVLSAKDNKELADGSATIRLYPRQLPDGVAKAVSGKRIFVWDRPEGLGEVLTAAGIVHERIDGPSGLSMARADMILVGPDQLSDKPFTQAPLIEQARGGANVLIFAQQRPPRLAGLALATRRPPAEIAWRDRHPLARHLRLFTPDELAPTVRALVLPAGAAVEAVGHWPVTDSRPVQGPLHAMAAVQAVGKGRLVFCQMPVGNWKTDPRSQLFLADALDYMSGPVRPTPATTRPAGSDGKNKGAADGNRRHAPSARSEGDDR